MQESIKDTVHYLVEKSRRESWKTVFLGSHLLDSITYTIVSLSLHEFCTDAIQALAEIIESAIQTT